MTDEETAARVTCMILGRHAFIEIKHKRYAVEGAVTEYSDYILRCTRCATVLYHTAEHCKACKVKYGDDYS